MPCCSSVRTARPTQFLRIYRYLFFPEWNRKWKIVPRFFDYQVPVPYRNFFFLSKYAKNNNMDPELWKVVSGSGSVINSFRSATLAVNIYLKNNFGSGSRSQIISAPPAPAPQPWLVDSSFWLYLTCFFYNFQICLNNKGWIRIWNSKNFVAGSRSGINDSGSATLQFTVYGSDAERIRF